jgi:hypothetical protein
MTKSNYKPSTMDSIQNIINVAEYSYIVKCKARGCTNPVPFRTMMFGYTVVVVGILGVIIYRLVTI